MQQRKEELPTSSRRGGLQPLAPRSSPASSPRERPSTSGSTRPGRLSHRSRAGCWTCRGRKVKCDEQHPRCGPCTRLNRECDWDHRWNFSDATSSTQGKYSNVTTAGNFVWDPDTFQPSNTAASRRRDDLPEFASLTSDEDRERKAETQPPGTFSVVATPESFSSLPEYAIAESSTRGRRASVQSARSSITSAASSGSQTIPRSADPNIAYIEYFDNTSSVSPQSCVVSASPARPTMRDAMQGLSISASPLMASPTAFANPLSGNPGLGGQLIGHFRRHIVPRLLQPGLDGHFSQTLVPGSTRDLFEIEAARFPPLYHAICALSALNLSCAGHVSLEEALQHYQHALSTTVSPTTAEDLLSDGVFLRHLLLFIYDICVPMDTEHGGEVMWAQHLSHLRSIAVQRHRRLGGEPHGSLLWLICELDMYACLLGSGSCEFVRTMLQYDMLPPLAQQIPSIGAGQLYLQDECEIFPAIQRLNEGVVLNTIKLAQLAQACRAEAATVRLPSPGASARWQAAVSRLQGEMVTFWAHAYPDFLGPDSHEAARNLPPRPRYVFEHAFLLHQSSIIYSRTSMFPHQGTIPLANQKEVLADTQRRCASILVMAGDYVSQARHQPDANAAAWRHMVFPVFVAGIATTQPDAKIHAIDIIRSMEGLGRGGIGQNTFRTRQLLKAVYEEQRRMASSGRRMEEVDWLTISKERCLSVVNCGL